ncbi:MAG: hypothetical protein FJ088_10960, partial [Deltaproteobacteria bacterium]|nr:hypothetical protein [Deltaproteobacteria bacterium]
MSFHETTHKPEAAADPSKLEGRTLSCGSYTIKHFSGILGLDNPANGYKIRAVAWVGSHIDISIISETKSEFVLTFQRSAPNIVGFYTSEFLTVFYRGQDLPRDLAEILDKNIRSNIGAYSIENLAEILCRDPEIGKPGLPKPPDIDQTDHPESLLNTWGGESAYA